MKYISFLLTINFLTVQCTDNFLSKQLHSFISKFSFGSDPSRYEEIQSEGGDDPLYVLLVSYDKQTTVGVVSNPMFLRQYIQDETFVDFLVACPPKDENQTSAEIKTEDELEYETRTLVIDKSYNFLLKKFKKQDIDSEKEADKIDTIDIQDHRNDEPSSSNLNQQKDQNIVLKQEKIKDNGDTPEYMNLVSNQKKKGIVNESNLAKNFEINSTNPIQKKPIEQEEISKLPQESNEDVNSSMEKKIGREDLSDSEYNATVDEAIPEKLSTSQSKIQKVQEPVDEKNKILYNPTPKTKNFKIQAMGEAENFKCNKPVKAHLVERRSYSMFKFYLAGFEIFMDKHKDFDITEFKSSSDRKYKWFWAFTIVLMKYTPNVVCVYQEVHYNKDTYRPEINDNFDNHDLGRKMMFPEMDISKLYGTENQENVFSKLFENEDERKKYFDIGAGNFLVKVHLAPLHNFLSPAVRQSGKTYGNVGLMWNSIRNGVWRRLENYIDILSHVLIELVVITGTYGTLNLDGKDVYLADENQLPVPLAFWKMVIYECKEDNSPGILIITYNNPYQKIDDVICGENSCQKYGWGHIQEDDFTKGRTICCRFTPEILAHIPILIGAQPKKTLNLYKLSSIFDLLWHVNEEGEKMTQKERENLFKKLQLDENFVDEENILSDENIGENVENENKQKVDEVFLKYTNELEGDLRPNKLVEV